MRLNQARLRSMLAVPRRAFLAAFLVFGSSCSAVPATVAAPTGPAVAMLPDRTLSCDLGHATNIDATKDQTDVDIVYDSRHAFSLHLPAVPERTTQPPDATELPEPVAKGTQIIADPDKLAGDVIGPFVRVIDLWPKRVEMTMPMSRIESKLIIISDIDEAAGRARLFMTNAKDLATFNMDRIYSGNCVVTIAKPKAKPARTR